MQIISELEHTTEEAYGVGCIVVLLEDTEAKSKQSFITGSQPAIDFRRKRYRAKVIIMNWKRAIIELGRLW